VYKDSLSDAGGEDGDSIKRHRKMRMKRLEGGGGGARNLLLLEWSAVRNFLALTEEFRQGSNPTKFIIQYSGGTDNGQISR